MNLWIFGHSACLPVGIDPSLGWVDRLCQLLPVDRCHNHADEAVDNFYIYHSLEQHLPSIKPDDTVIIGWSHPSRKTFVLDRSNPAHQTQLQQGARVYKTDPEFFRSVGVKHDYISKWMSMMPVRQGNTYFDTWFENYYSDIEAKTNFSAYLAAATHRIPGRYLPFYFSRHSVMDLDVDSNNFFWLDFIKDNQVWISDSDSHPNEKGHEMIADILYKQLTSV